MTLKGDDAVGVEEDIAEGRFAIVRIVRITGIRITDRIGVRVLVGVVRVLVGMTG